MQLPSRGDSAPRILLIRLKAIGDVLFTLPAVHRIRQAFPESKISYLISKENAQLLRGFRGVDEVIALDRARLRGGNPAAMLNEGWSLLRRLRGEEFSLVVDFQGYVETAALAWWTRAPLRWGTVYNRGRSWAYSRPVPRRYNLHPANWNLSLLGHCGLEEGDAAINAFELPDDALAEAKRLAPQRGLQPGKPILFIQPFTSTSHKNWPFDDFLRVAHYWRERGLQIFFGGGPADLIALQQARAAGFPVSEGESLLVTAGFMKLSTLVLGGESGIPHLATAMGNRVLMIIHSNVPGTGHPFRHPEWTVTPKDNREVSNVQVGQVIDACARAFSELGIHAPTSA